MLRSSYAPNVWVKWTNWPGEFACSYDQQLWFPTTWEDLAEKRYKLLVNPSDEVGYNRNGEVVGAATKAVEATPKYVPPLFEEREV
jgi:hypothetical protein